MIKKNKLKVVISSIIILLPILFGIIVWEDLPNTMTTHFGADGISDGFSGKAFAVFGLPCILLVLHFFCLFFTMLDKKQKEQSEKALGMVFWIVPMISLVANGIIYCAAFGANTAPSLLVCVLFGAMFIFMGNYMPKVKQNSTLGVKVTWTLRNEENWSLTHRFTGKIWVICGFALLICTVLPINTLFIALFSVIAVAVILPIAYSYRIYRRHRKQGIEYGPTPTGETGKLGVIISAIIVTVILIGVAILMFTGDIEVDCEDTSFKINATYYTDIEVDYTDIDTIEYRDDLDVGVRANGFGSARLSMGIFQNEEFGSYTLYAYTSTESYLIIHGGEDVLVLGGDCDEMREIYEEISAKIE